MERRLRTSLARSRAGRFMAWLGEHRGVELASHEELWRWSVTDLDGFWSAVWEFFGVTSHAPYTSVLASRTMPGAQWFPGARINYAEHALRTARTLAGSWCWDDRRPGRTST